MSSDTPDKLCPREPTPEMIEAGVLAWTGDPHQIGPRAPLIAVYEAMYDAAPSTPPLPVEQKARELLIELLELSGQGAAAYTVRTVGPMGKVLGSMAEAIQRALSISSPEGIEGGGVDEAELVARLIDLHKRMSFRIEVEPQPTFGVADAGTVIEAAAALTAAPLLGGEDGKTISSAEMRDRLLTALQREPAEDGVIQAVEEEITAWAFAHDLDGALRNDLMRRVRDRFALPAVTDGGENHGKQ